jgi:hypothetical protein
LGAEAVLAAVSVQLMTRALSQGETIRLGQLQRETEMTKLGMTVGAIFVLLGAALVAFAEPATKRTDCATLDIAAMAMIEEHGRVEDIPSDRLYGAALVMQQAREACDARFAKARALYELVLSLGPVVGHEPEE